MYTIQSLEESPTQGTPTLLPGRSPDENLAVSDGTRILCKPMMIQQNQMFIGAFGPEQTKIVYTFARILAAYEGLNIRSVCTSRSEGGAGSYILLSDIWGEADRLVAFGRSLQANPWFEPQGARVVANAVVDLKIFAPASRQMLVGALGIISEEYGVNIESMAHRTFHSMFDDGFDLLRQARSGAGGIPQGSGGFRQAGNLTEGEPGGGGGSGGGGASGIDIGADGAGASGRSGDHRCGGGGEGGGGGAPGASGGIGTGGDGAGAYGAGGNDGVSGDGREGGGGDATGIGGGADGVHATRGKGVNEAGAAEFVTVTHMRLELPHGTNLRRLKRELELFGKDWDFRWEEHTGQGKLDRKLLRMLFGGLN